MRMRFTCVSMLLLLLAAMPGRAMAQEQTFINTLIERSTDYTTSILQKILAFMGQDSTEVAPIPEDTKDALQFSLLHQALSIIYEQIPPFIFGNHAVFTYYDTKENSNVHMLSSADNYSTLQPFVRIPLNKKVLVLFLPRQHEDRTLHYRLVVDGIWTHDSSNPNSTIDNNGIKISTIRIPALERHYLPSYIPLGDTKVRFIFYQNGFSPDYKTTTLAPMQSYPTDETPVFLTASFTGWDPFFLKMRKTGEQVYYVDVELYPGTHYYYFQVGNNTVLDPRNENIVRLQNGLFVNKLVIPVPM